MKNVMNKKEEMNRRMREADMYRALIQDECDHKHGKRESVEFLNKKNNQDMITAPANGWSHTAVKCTECGTIFETKPYRHNETNEGIRMFHSMANQYKLFVELPEAEDAMMMEVLAAVHTLDKFQKLYGKMVKDMTNKKDNNNNNNNNRKRGGFGFNSNQFKGRSNY